MRCNRRRRRCRVADMGYLARHAHCVYWYRYFISASWPSRIALAPEAPDFPGSCQVQSTYLSTRRYRTPEQSRNRLISPFTSWRRGSDSPAGCPARISHRKGKNPTKTAHLPPHTHTHTLIKSVWKFHYAFCCRGRYRC